MATTAGARLRLGRIERDALAIGVATGAYGVSFGVLAVVAGLSVAQACVMSLLVFTGASQFAAIGVIGAGGGAAAALAPALLLAGRNALYGLSLVPVLRRVPIARRAVEAQLIIDETTAMARAQDDPADAHRAFLATGVSVYVLWNLGTLAGALLGGGIGDPEALGLDTMFPRRVHGAPRAAAAPGGRDGRGGGGRAHRARADLAHTGRRADPRRRARCRPCRPRRATSAGVVSWFALLGLAAASYVLKAAGPLLAGDHELRPALAQALELVAVPLLAAVIVVQTLDGGERLVADARLPALGVAAVLTWRRAPFLVVVLAAAATAALLRAV
jgi:branched-subunit amino acid transport protein